MVGWCMCKPGLGIRFWARSRRAPGALCSRYAIGLDAWVVGIRFRARPRRMPCARDWMGYAWVVGIRFWARPRRPPAHSTACAATANSRREEELLGSSGAAEAKERIETWRRAARWRPCSSRPSPCRLPCVLLLLLLALGKTGPRRRGRPAARRPRPGVRVLPVRGQRRRGGARDAVPPRVPPRLPRPPARHLPALPRHADTLLPAAADTPRPQRLRRRRHRRLRLRVRRRLALLVRPRHGGALWHMT